MELQIGLAIVDEMNGGKETRQRMQGWMAWESKHGKRLRALGATALVALAARLDPVGTLPARESVQASTANPA